MKNLQAFPSEKRCVKTRKACATDENMLLGCQGLFFSAKAFFDASSVCNVALTSERVLLKNK